MTRDRLRTTSTLESLPTPLQPAGYPSITRHLRTFLTLPRRQAPTPWTSNTTSLYLRTGGLYNHAGALYTARTVIQVNDPIQAIDDATDQVHAYLADLPPQQAWQVATGAIEAWNSAGGRLVAARLQILWHIWQTLPDPTVRTLADELGISVTRAQQLLTAARAQLRPATSAHSESHASGDGEPRQG
jgi:hypothetical protein